mmetsp:Transcript_11725/g.38592  ORF Transcript_11725/g.38592 Transcript_11725/m.38592 type:complete len:217 (+) Transcript_11725:88-738(+)|eukprot:CAMPEP_0118907262 /NCGR_PEP_ID=MMETSP1166-20130328/10794_1 /TAXON_ID=1104430 /ORGANISM="Chrysoreinhardia sp, Strain CCMP3193" /LENGTH=216 /DNA_ID=CAMNT_0006846625 /DNA_START=93 /DNA_END=746 /DNA_ORIENTATION=+
MYTKNVTALPQACASVLTAATFYEVLGVDETADAAAIRKNYLKISIRVHPDRNRDPQATAAFQRVSEAFATLSDDQKRRDYDQQRLRTPFEKTTATKDVEFSFVDALRVFRAAVSAAQMAGFACNTPMADCIRIASALLALRDVGAGSTFTDTAGIAAGMLGTAAAAVSLLPESWQLKVKEHATPENALKAVGTAVVVAGVLSRAMQQRTSDTTSR